MVPEQQGARNERRTRTNDNKQTLPVSSEPLDGAFVEMTDILSLLERREIYTACHAAGMKAVSLANTSHPLDRLPADSEAARAYLSKREKVYKDAREKGRHEVVERYGIDAARLDAIDEEGDRERWPIWDGPSDERGPIPSFGPGRTDESDRILMNDEERAARRDAAIRALAAIGQITDDTDTDERWADAFRGLEKAS
jgi:hypothetical protein